MFDPARLVFIDETSAKTKMVGLRGRCPRGERLVGRVPQGHWKTITFVGGSAPEWQARRPIRGRWADERQSSWPISRCLAPTLKHRDIVIIDILPAHKAAAVHKAIEAPRCDTLLPAQIFAGP